MNRPFSSLIAVVAMIALLGCSRKITAERANDQFLAELRQAQRSENVAPFVQLLAIVNPPGLDSLRALSPERRVLLTGVLQILFEQQHAKATEASASNSVWQYLFAFTSAPTPTSGIVHGFNWKPGAYVVPYVYGVPVDYVVGAPLPAGAKLVFAFVDKDTAEHRVYSLPGPGAQ